jgi:hypothetical protein
MLNEKGNCSQGLLLCQCQGAQDMRRSCARGGNNMLEKLLVSTCRGTPLLKNGFPHLVGSCA